MEISKNFVQKVVDKPSTLCYNIMVITSGCGSVWNGSPWRDYERIRLGEVPNGSMAFPMVQFYRLYRGVAQFGRALRSGRRGRVFESRHPDHKKQDGFCHPAFYFPCCRVRTRVPPKSRTRDVGQKAPGEPSAARTLATEAHFGAHRTLLWRRPPPRAPRATRGNYSGIVIL